MPKEIKKIVVERNLKLLAKVSIVLFFVSVLTLLPLLFSSDSRGPETSDYIFHYTSMSVVQLLSAIFSFIMLKSKKIRKSNIILVLNFATLEFLCYWIFAFGVNSFNSLIIFVCLATIMPVVYSMEPLYYMIVLIIMGVLMGPKFVELYGQNSASNAVVYLFVMIGLAMNRWFSIKRNEIYEFKTKEREKQIQQELEMAALVQKSFYQHNLTDIKKWEVVYYNDPMLSVSGDLFDFFVRKNSLEGLCIFDVSGHGLASGLVTMLVKNTMEEEFYENEDVELDFTMQRINERVRMEKGDIENYLTGIILRFTENNVEMVNAGHPNPVLYHSSTDSYEYFNCDKKDVQGAIGLSDFDFNFTTLEINPEVNDRLVFYTDGVIEAKNLVNEEYGYERFLESLQKHRDLDIGKQLTAIIDDIKQFIGTAPRTDDISIIIIEKK